MQIQSLSLDALAHYPDLLKKYLSEDSSLKSLYPYSPDLKGLTSALAQRKFPQEKRMVLVDHLKNTSYHTHEAQKTAIEYLSKEETFTVTTGHQLNLATGPLYFIYKIISTIRLAEELAKHFSDKKFVPVYWMASEDHDVEEISDFQVFGQNYHWDSAQSGPVGRMHPPGKDFWSQIPDFPTWMLEAYTGSQTLAEAHAKVVSYLFGSYGLIILDPDSTLLKAQFSPYLLKELVEQSSTPAMQEAEKTLLDANYSAQVFGRPINLFYLENGRRERIIPTGEDTFEVLNTDLKFNEAAIRQLVQEQPEKFSPNVVLRPLYQEVILPNLAYLGGPAEVSYWLQLKPIFDLWEVPMPVILPRNFSLIVNGALQKKLDKIGIGAEELLDEFAEVKKKWLNQQAGEQLNFTIEKHQLTQLFNALSDKTKAIDGSLVGWLEAERSKSEKQLENIEKRLSKALEGKQETQIKQLAKVHEKLMPDGVLQERKENILTYLINQPDLIERLLPLFNPLDYRLHIFYPDGAD